jgi:FKBP-type peptidyl-prolyl cis-trans isomerase FkpA
MAGMARNRPLLQFSLAVLVGSMSACGGKPAATPPSPVTSMQSVQLKPGTGDGIAPGKIAVVQYTGWLYEDTAKDYKGKQFDSSRNTGQPFRFPLGAGNVIKGWDQGVVGMKIGESRRLVIPANLAYGDSGAGGVIPPGAALVFDIDLIAIE